MILDEEPFMPDLPTGTVTLLFTDIEGSTRLLQRLGEHYAAVLADCRHLLRSLFQQYHGHEVDTQGDAFFVAFARATDAISAAISQQPAYPADSFYRTREGSCGSHAVAQAIRRATGDAYGTRWCG